MGYDEEMEEAECELCRGDGEIPCEQCGGLYGRLNKCSLCTDGKHRHLIGTDLLFTDS